jgi:hypothetical protein
MRTYAIYSLFHTNIQLLVLIKTSYRHSYNEFIHSFTAYGHNHQNKHIYIYILRCQRKNTYQKITPGVMQLLRGVLVSTQP